MNMMKPNKHTYIVLLTFVVVFLFGCSQEQQKETPVDTKREVSSQEVPVQEAVNEQTEQVIKAKEITSADQQQEASENVTPELASQDVPVQETVNEQAAQTKEVSEQALSSQENLEAEQKLVFARSYLSMAQKGIAGYGQTVAICRGIIKDYPGTQYEVQAKQILGLIPDDQRSQFKITDEELKP